jgi:hypothetical protein
MITTSKIGLGREVTLISYLALYSLLLLESLATVVECLLIPVRSLAGRLHVPEKHVSQEETTHALSARSLVALVGNRPVTKFGRLFGIIFVGTFLATIGIVKEASSSFMLRGTSSRRNRASNSGQSCRDGFRKTFRHHYLLR